MSNILKDDGWLSKPPAAAAAAAAATAVPHPIMTPSSFNQIEYEWTVRLTDHLTDRLFSLERRRNNSETNSRVLFKSWDLIVQRKPVDDKYQLYMCTCAAWAPLLS